jgi:hypothetical protein
VPGIASAAFIGSASPISRSTFGPGSDVDLLIILRDESFQNVLDSIAPLAEDVRVINSWGVVSGANSSDGQITLHLHLDVARHYLLRSALYRISVSKYTSFLGSDLKEYCNQLDILMTTLREDPLGPWALRQKLLADELPTAGYWAHDGMAWRYLEFGQIYGTPTDWHLYASLHSVRNLLRAQSGYHELMPDRQLTSAWQTTDVVIRALVRLIEEKARRRAQQTPLLTEAESAAFALTVLDAIVSAM